MISIPSIYFNKEAKDLEKGGFWVPPVVPPVPRLRFLEEGLGWIDAADKTDDDDVAVAVALVVAVASVVVAVATTGGGTGTIVIE